MGCHAGHQPIHQEQFDLKDLAQGRIGLEEAMIELLIFRFIDDPLYFLNHKRLKQMRKESLGRVDRGVSISLEQFTRKDAGELSG